VNISQMTMALLFGRQTNDGADCADARAVNALEANLVAGDAKPVDFGDERTRVNAGRDQRAERHIAADAGEAIEVERLHSSVCPMTSGQQR
jgi:hypothetical protein